MEEKRKSRVKQERGERGEEKRKRKENVFSFFSFAYARLCVRTYVCVYARAFSQRIGVLRGGCDSSCARGRRRTRRGRERERERASPVPVAGSSEWGRGSIYRLEKRSCRQQDCVDSRSSFSLFPLSLSFFLRLTARFVLSFFAAARLARSLSLSLASSLGRSLSRLNGVTVFFPWRRENEYAQNCKFRPFPSISFRRWNFTRRRFIFASFIVRFAFEKRSWLHFVRSHFWVDRWVGFLPSFLPSPRGEFFIGLNIFPFAILIILYRIYIYRIKVQTGVCSF